jgi:hypothetical protein
MSSIREELDTAEAALTSLCEAVQRKTSSAEMRAEYHTLLNQATSALNRIRSLAETDDWFSSGEHKRIIKSLTDK